MEIFFVTGKGGVGKSAVASALALAQAQAGKKTYLVELCEPSFLNRFLQVSSTTESVVQPLRENLSLAHWPGPYCLRDYAKYLLKMESLVSLFFENPVSQSLINIAPALKELAILGKITSGPPRNVGPKIDADCLVVDAFSSGHFVALLKAPEGMAEAIRRGPMAEQSRDIIAVLKNPQVCKYWIVSQPEDLPVTEALELAAEIRTHTGQEPQHILNRCLEAPTATPPPEIPELEPFFKQVHTVLERQKQMLARLQESGAQTQTLPWVMQLDPWRLIESLAAQISQRGSP
jgi:anion-transporting  ArsA/GET3 family ATPase